MTYARFDSLPPHFHTQQQGVKHEAHRQARICHRSHTRVAVHHLPPLEEEVKKPRKPSSMTVHHIKPRSRKGDNSPDNLVHWDDTLHRSYHNIFSNLTLTEAIEMLIIISRPGGYWDKKNLEALRQSIKEEA